MSAVSKIDEATEALRMAQKHLKELETTAKCGLSLATVLRYAEAAEDKIHDALAALGE